MFILETYDAAWQCLEHTDCLVNYSGPINLRCSTGGVTILKRYMKIKTFYQGKNEKLFI